jgi:hypothetical protein
MENGTVILWTQIVTAVVAVGGLLRPEITRLFLRFRKKVSVTTYGKIEIGFSTLGPVIGLVGRVKAHECSTEIFSFDGEVIRLRDKATHRFSWFASRPLSQPIIGIRPDQLHEYTVVIPYSIGANEERLFNYLLRDNETSDRITHTMKPLIDKINNGQNLLQRPDEVTQLRNSKVFLDAYNSLGELNYWHAGDYSLIIAAKDANERKLFEVTKLFSISNDDANALKLNNVACLESVLGNLPNEGFGAFSFKWVDAR